MSTEGLTKLNLKLNERVQIMHIGGGFDGRTGKNLGIAYENVINFYIILLDTPLPDHLAIIMPEGCLIPL